MKTQKLNKKLVLKKQRITNLNGASMSVIKGGLNTLELRSCVYACGLLDTGTCNSCKCN